MKRIYFEIVKATSDIKHIHWMKLRVPQRIREELSMIISGYGKSSAIRIGKYWRVSEDSLKAFIHRGTSSNSQMLSKDINTKFRGRSTEIRVYPLSFSEYKSYKKSIPRLDGKKRLGDLLLDGGPVEDDSKILKEYLLYGGFPYIAQLDTEEEKHRQLNNMCNTELLKDIKDRHNLKNKNENLLNAVFDLLCSQIGSYVSANKITNYLRSNGYPRVTPDTIGNYLEHLCDAFLLYKVQRYDIKGKRYLKSLNKYYVKSGIVDLISDSWKSPIL